MGILNDLGYRVRALFQHKAVEQELEEELRFHMEREVEKNRRAGMSEADARRRARMDFGAHEKAKEDCREARGTSFIELTMQDAHYALRQLRANPTFALVMILTLALSIGANSAIFSVIDGVLLKKLPYADPQQIMRIFLSSKDFPKFSLNPNDLRDFRAQNSTFSSMALFARNDVQVSGSGEPVKLSGFGITSGYFRLLGLQPAMGREFTFAEELPGNGQEAVISDRLWRSRFNADPQILGRKITMNMQPYTVVGVMPPGTMHPGNEYHAVSYGESVDVWMPFTFDHPLDRGSHYVEGIGRLKDGVTPAQATADLNGLWKRMNGGDPVDDDHWHMLVSPLAKEIVGKSRQMVLVLLGAVGMVLLIACANAANLQLARASARQREIAVRLAMGAPRGRVVRQLLTESLLLSLAGGGLGLLLALGGVKALVLLLPANFPRSADIHVNATVLMFTFAVSVAAGILFGLTPALHASRTDPKTGLQKGGRGSTAGRQQNSLRNALVVTEVSMACVLLIGAGLMLRSFINLMQVDRGFEQQQVLTASISMPHETYVKPEQRVTFIHDLGMKLNSMPGVKAAGLGSDLPWTGYDENAGLNIEGIKPPPGESFHMRYHRATPGYFEALGIPLVKGRFFNDGDVFNGRKVILINRAIAEKYMPGVEPVGHRMTFSDNPKPEDWMTVVGVVGDVKDQPGSAHAEPGFWWPYAQSPDFDLSMVVRAQGDPRRMADSVRAIVQGMDPSLAVADVRLMDSIVDAQIATPRFAFALVGLFAGLALVLAAMGAYGVIAYTVNQRTSEFGLRLALGAQRGNLVGLVLRQSARLAIPGTLIGVALALGLGRVLKSVTYEVRATDPAVLCSVAGIVLVVAMLAAYVPARRAGRADPMDSLRAE